MAIIKQRKDPSISPLDEPARNVLPGSCQLGVKGCSAAVVLNRFVPRPNKRETASEERRERFRFILATKHDRVSLQRNSA